MLHPYINNHGVFLFVVFVHAGAQILMLPRLPTSTWQGPLAPPVHLPAPVYVASLMSVSFNTLSCFRVISARMAA